MTTNYTIQENQICPDCKGNGYVSLRLEAEETIKQCKTCHSNGEITTKEFSDYWNKPAIAKVSESLSCC